MALQNSDSRNSVEILEDSTALKIANKMLAEKVENQAKEIEMLHEQNEELRRLNEGKKIPTKKWCSGKADICTVKDLEELTDNFSEQNFIGDTSYGKLYQGKLKLDSSGAKTKDVVVKIWDEKADRLDDGKVVKEEVKFLVDSLGLHRNLPKLISFCKDGDSDPLLKKGVVYDVHALGRLCDYIPKDNFSWIQRFKVAYELALLLEHLHIPDRPYVLYNMETENILLNQEYSPVVVDFGLLFGGHKGGPRYIQDFVETSYGYDDPYLAYAGKRTAENDVYSYGINLLALMAKRTDKDVDSFDDDSIANMLGTWALREYGDGCSLVNSSLTEDEYYEEADGIALTKLALDCIQYKIDECPERPSVYDVVASLEELSIFRRMESFKFE